MVIGKVVIEFHSNDAYKSEIGRVLDTDICLIHSNGGASRKTNLTLYDNDVCINFSPNVPIKLVDSLTSMCGYYELISLASMNKQFNGITFEFFIRDGCRNIQEYLNTAKLLITEYMEGR